MAGRARPLWVAVEYVSRDLGLWCRPCALSTGARVWFTTRVQGGATELRSNVFCTDCGSRDVEDDQVAG